MTLGIATQDDIPALCDLLAILFEQEAEFVADRDKQSQGLSMLLENPGLGTILVSRETDKIIGMVILLYSLSTALGARVSTLEDMIVLPDYRRQGIGETLIQHAIHTATQAGCQRITLLTDDENVIGQAFYRKQGFKASSMRPYRLILSPPPGRF